MSKLHLSADSSKSLPKVLSSASELIVLRRKQPTARKPVNYLLAVMPDKSKIYVSSLFPTTEFGLFMFDYQGQGFKFLYSNHQEVIITLD